MLITWEQAIENAIRAAEDADEYARVERWDRAPVFTQAATARAQMWTDIAAEIHKGTGTSQ